MRWARWMWIVALVACDDPGELDPWWDEEDTGLWDAPDPDTAADDTGSPQDLPVAWDLSGWSSWEDAFVIQPAGSGRITLSMQTTGVGGPAALYLGSTEFTQNWDEEHTLAQVSAAFDGTSSAYERELTCRASVANQTADASTLFRCDNDVNGFSPGTGNQQVTFAVAVWPEEATGASGPPEDCVVFGHSPSTLLGASVPAGLNLPAWLTAAACRDVNEVGR